MSLHCPLQDSLSPMQFIERLGLGYAIQRADRELGIDPENPAEADQRRAIRIRLDGTERQMPRATVRDLYNDFLGQARSHCMHCPVNKTPSPYGCVGVVPLPLSAKGEKWLFDSFAPPDPAKSYWLRRLRVGALPSRRHGMLLASSVEFRRGFGDGQPEVTSAQIFYLLLNLREPDGEARLRLLYEFGAIGARPRQIEELSELIAKAADDGPPATGPAPGACPGLPAIRKAIDRFKVRIKFDKSDDESISALKQYFLFGLQSLNAGVALHASLM